MNAIELLMVQHREVEMLFAEIEEATEPSEKEDLFIKLADRIVIHASLEEHNFYPMVREKRTDDILFEALEEHLGIKRVLGELLDLEMEDRRFDEKMKVLHDEIGHHVEAEEGELFPKVCNIFGNEELEAIGRAMIEEQAELEQIAPSAGGTLGGIKKVALI
jgi:hemerythrin superfamily protein